MIFTEQHLVNSGYMRFTSLTWEYDDKDFSEHIEITQEVKLLSKIKVEIIFSLMTDKIFSLLL